MTLSLHEKGLFTWDEWANFLGAEIKAAGLDDPTENYYRHWLTALEKLLTEKGVVGETERVDRRDAWERAALATPHGQPIELGAEMKGE